MKNVNFIDDNCICIYDDIFMFNGEFAHVRIANKWGFINKKFDEIVPCLYTFVESFTALDNYELNIIRIEKLKIII